MPINDPWASGVLIKGTHDMLVQDAAAIARRAGIPVHYLWKKLSESCGEAELAWVKDFRRHAPAGGAGAYYSGSVSNVPDRMAAIAGCLLRNHTTAQVVVRNRLLASIEEGEPYDDTCVLVPDFFTGEKTSNEPGWKLAALYGYLLDRANDGKQTVLMVSQLGRLRTQYGQEIHDLIVNKYIAFAGSAS